MNKINKSSLNCQSFLVLTTTAVLFFELTIGTTVNSSSSGPIFTHSDSDTMNNDELNVQTLIKKNVISLQPTPFQPIHHPCDDLLNTTSEAFAEFYKCSIRNARPYRFCEKCSAEYLKAIDLYDDILASGHNTSIFNCKKYLLESDNSPVIPSAIANIVTIWGDAYCENCYDKSPSNNTELSDTILNFLSLYANLTDCISQSIVHEPPVNICKNCEEIYNRLNKCFNRIEKQSVSTVCMDIMDRMNYTRIQWGKDFNCTTTRPSDTNLISFIVTMSVTVPALYYISVYIVSKGVGRVRDKLIKRHNARARLNKRYGSYESIDQTAGINSPSVPSSSQT